ncbi:MAG TPA: endonuclease/exonuclease/phosphatase family protein [Puia sp.]|nr:endonuclease/exonuclease/phosphatase family protein [Puia sp.]
MISLRKFTIRLFILLNIITGILFLLTCCNAFLHPDKWWLISLLAFFFPLFLVLLLLFLIFWLFLRKRYALISLLCLLIGWKNIHAFFGFSLTKHDFSRKDNSSLRILTWNVRSWDEFTTKKLDASGHRLPMLRLVGKQNADVLCFQEFFEPADTSKSNIRYIQKELQFPYYFFSRDFHFRNTRYELGTIIFSKYPIIKSYQIRFSADTNVRTESLISTDLDVNNKTLRIYTTHLQSVLFKQKDFRNVEIIRNAEDSMLQASRSLAKKLKGALGLRGYQADTVRRQLDACSVPYVICGDFNDVPNSYTYFHIRGNLQDAFIEKCFGIGRSYIHISPTLRIDYILPSKEFKVIQTMRLTSPYSDHHAVITDLRLQE